MVYDIKLSKMEQTMLNVAKRQPKKEHKTYTQESGTLLIKKVTETERYRPDTAIPALLSKTSR